MRILYLTFTFHAPWLHSLKEKRSEVRHLLQGLRHKFNVSACEAAEQDRHQTIVLAVAALAANSAQADSIGQSLLDYLEARTEAELVCVEQQLY